MLELKLIFEVKCLASSPGWAFAHKSQRFCENQNSIASNYPQPKQSEQNAPKPLGKTIFFKTALIF